MPTSSANSLPFKVQKEKRVLYPFSGAFLSQRIAPSPATEVVGSPGNLH
jgi:hypothetical protein